MYHDHLYQMGLSKHPKKNNVYRIAYYNRVKQRTAVFRYSRGLFNNIRQIKQIHGVNQFMNL